MEFVSPEGLRLDGRRPKEVRQLKAELGVLPAADGSASFEMGNTKVRPRRRHCRPARRPPAPPRPGRQPRPAWQTHVQVIAAVFGPKEVEQRGQADPARAIVRCEYAMAAFSTGERRRRGKTDRRATELSMVIRNTLEQTILLDLLPRTQLDVYVQVLQADGGTRCAGINAAFLALADAGVPMRDTVAACAAGYLDSTALLDLNYLEDGGGGPDVAVALHPSLDKVVLLQADARVGVDTFEEVLQLASAGCRAVAAFMREALVERVRGLSAARGAAGPLLPPPPTAADATDP